MHYIFGIIATCIDSVGYEGNYIHLGRVGSELTYLLREFVGILFRIFTLRHTESIAPSTFREHCPQGIAVNVFITPLSLLVNDTVLNKVYIEVSNPRCMRL